MKGLGRVDELVLSPVPRGHQIPLDLVANPLA